jgi:hypothetical protein
MGGVLKSAAEAREQMIERLNHRGEFREQHSDPLRSLPSLSAPRGARAAINQDGRRAWIAEPVRRGGRGQAT